MFDAVTAAASITDEDRYAAFARRDASLRGAFVMGVKTTGIYCRAGCPARTPKRENVRFFAEASEARAAGFRPCLRCRPDGAVSDRSALVADACRYIEAQETAPTLEQVAAWAGVSPYHFHRQFKAETGVTPKAYAAAVLDRRARDALAAGAGVVEAALDAGYGSVGRFHEAARKRMGMTPAAFRSRGAGAALRVSVAPCSLGWVLVAATQTGLAAVELGDDPQAMTADFRTRFSAATAVEDDAALTRLVEQVVGLIDGETTGADLPLDVRGTAFQQRVWEALRRIPAGEVRTYAAIAAEIGAPKAVRAVGAACGANPVAVVTPCHRVVGSSGKLTGYRWGVERKRALLDREGR